MIIPTRISLSNFNSKGSCFVKVTKLQEIPAPNNKSNQRKKNGQFGNEYRILLNNGPAAVAVIAFKNLKKFYS